MLLRVLDSWSSTLRSIAPTTNRPEEVTTMDECEHDTVWQTEDHDGPYAFCEDCQRVVTAEDGPDDFYIDEYTGRVTR